jgi:hypothetical protein
VWATPTMAAGAQEAQRKVGAGAFVLPAGRELASSGVCRRLLACAEAALVAGTVPQLCQQVPISSTG